MQSLPFASLERRAFLKLAGAGLMTAPHLAAKPRSDGTRACIFLVHGGGLSHLDTFDMKPAAPAEIRGEFRSITTNVPGIRICEHLPRIAAQMDKLVIVRSMTSEETNHERARHRLLTGLPLSPGVVREPAGTAFPALAGTPVERWYFTAAGGCLRRCAAEVVSPDHLSLEVLGPALLTADHAAPVLPARTPAEYGPSLLGAACHAALAFVEAGATFVVIHEPRFRYDTHHDNFRALRERLLPAFDRVLSGLVADLQRRSLLRSTLLAAVGEFGRSPVINRHGGRDHHAHAWSACLAGGGLEGGRVVGATDERGFYVMDDPVRPQDLLASLPALAEHHFGPAGDGSAIAGGRLVPSLCSSHTSLREKT